ncbi:hypothetical protein DVH24_041487 [Malus domestica]|uniref:AP2/ERF domain-containing protein n=1 Tax=Malus domestica TaxID=3750 RepID=A0A498IAY5_MALDO|nr:hypothetical protein DVH24_041487 [Malus domestica]
MIVERQGCDVGLSETMPLGERDLASRERRKTQRERDRDLVRGRHAACKQTKSQGVYDLRERETARKREYEIEEEGVRDRATVREGKGIVGISLNDEYSDVKKDDLSKALWLALQIKAPEEKENCTWSLQKSSGFSRGASMYRRITRRHLHGRWLARIGKVTGNKDLYLGHSRQTCKNLMTSYKIAKKKKECIGTTMIEWIIDTYLGRAWRGRPHMVYAYTSMTKVVNLVGWSNDNHPKCYVACEEYTNKTSLSLALDIFRVVNCVDNRGEGLNVYYSSSYG